jgi:hypothetical protein
MRHSRKLSDSSLFIRTHAWQSVVIALLLVITASMPLFLADSYFMHVLILAFVYMVVTASFRVVVISGQYPSRMLRSWALELILQAWLPYGWIGRRG